jgi:hypothetical protein
VRRWARFRQFSTEMRCSMDPDDNWDAVAARLRRSKSIAVVQFIVGRPITEDDHEVLKLMEATPPPPSIMRFLNTCNGIKLLWSGTVDGKSVQGSVNIVTMVKSALRAPALEGGAPLEGVLWDDEDAPEVLKDLKRMAIFEDIAGRSAFLTYFVDEADARLFLVQDSRIRPIVPDFDTTIALLKRYAGADGLREYLTHDDWRALTESDDTLKRIAAL